MAKITYEKQEILDMIDAHRQRWNSIKGKEQDVTQENFIDNVLWALDMIASYFVRA